MASTGGTRLKVLCFSWLQTLWRATASHTGLCFHSSAAGGGADGCWQVTGAQVIVESWGFLSIVGSERDESRVALNAFGSDWYWNDGKIINLAFTFFGYVKETVTHATWSTCTGLKSKSPACIQFFNHIRFYVCALNHMEYILSKQCYIFV